MQSKNSKAQNKQTHSGADKPAVASARPRIGAHCNGGMKGAVVKAREIGAEAVQIFIGSPQTWKTPTPPAAEFNDFRMGTEKHALGPVFVHGNYLVNLGASSFDNLKKSIENLYTTLRHADRAGAQGLIFHPGSAGNEPYAEALQRVIKSIEIVLTDYSGSCKLVMEVCAGSGETIGDRFEEFADILQGMGNDERLAVCWDTCHLYSSGYDIRSGDGLEKTIDEFEKHVGFDRLVAVHANDSKTPFGSRKDRHENIGQGSIGEEAFGRMLKHPLLRPLPWILEVPGFSNKGPDVENISILKRLAGE